MHTIPIHQRLIQQYQGFLQGQDVRTSHQRQNFSIFETSAPSIPTTSILQHWEQTISPYLVLGKRVEHFMSYYLQNDTPYRILAQNIQVFDNKITLGEIDFLIQHRHSRQVIHLEQVYKFYLYVPKASLYHNDPWIGPNYKDSLQQKMDKLSQKQFPLLQHPKTQDLLHELGINSSTIEQHLSFKAALFVPYYAPFCEDHSINKACIQGYWMRLDEFETNKFFQDQQFFLPQKQDWGSAPIHHTNWKSYSIILEQIKISLANKRAPMCWVKQKGGSYSKLFIVWW